MKKMLYFSLVLAMALLFASCKKEQTVKTDRITFEKLDPGADGVYKGEDGAGGFQSGNAFFPTHYSEEYGSWSGFAYTNHHDDTTRGFVNQFSAIAGEGAGHSKLYAVFYSWQSDTITFDVPEKVTNISVCNSTYAYFAMLEGDQYSKKFGGESGNDPDFFKLIMEGLDENYNKVLEAEVSLADFTFDDNSHGLYR